MRPGCALAAGVRLRPRRVRPRSGDERLRVSGDDQVPAMIRREVTIWLRRFRDEIEGKVPMYKLVYSRRISE